MRSQSSSYLLLDVSEIIGNLITYLLLQTKNTFFFSNSNLFYFRLFCSDSTRFTAIKVKPRSRIRTSNPCNAGWSKTSPVSDYDFSFVTSFSEVTQRVRHFAQLIGYTLEKNRKIFHRFPRNNIIYFVLMLNLI